MIIGAGPIGCFMSQLAKIRGAQKVIMIDRVWYLGGKYLERGEILLEEKETLHEMYDAYKELGGNGHLETAMHEVDRLPVASK